MLPEYHFRSHPFQWLNPCAYLSSQVKDTPTCTVLSVTDTEITCTPPLATMGYYAVVVVNNVWGLASAYPVVTLHSGVSSVSPNSGTSLSLSVDAFCVACTWCGVIID